MCKVQISEGLGMQLRLGRLQLVGEEEDLPALSRPHFVPARSCSLTLVLCSDGLCTEPIALKRAREFDCVLEAFPVPMCGVV